MAENEILETIRQLIKLTSVERLKWGNTADDEIFRARFKSAVVHIVRELGAEGGEGYELVVLNEEGRELTRYVARDAESVPLLRRLWELAHRSARNPDKVWQQLRAEIEGMLQPSEK